MQLAFGTLTIQGFRSFDAPTSVDLSVPGLTYLVGDNKVEPHLGANGVGKSSIFEALYWVLYGKTSRNLRAAEVANWNSDRQCLVELDFTPPTSYLPIRLQRTWSPNTLTLAGVTCTQPELNALVGLSEEAFLHTITHQQFVPHFADRAPAVQLELFSEVLALEVWEQASALAGEWARAAQNKVQQAQLNVSAARASVQELAESVTAEQEKELLWWRAKVQACRLQSDEHMAALARLEEVKAETGLLGNGELSELTDRLSKLGKDAASAITLANQAMDNLTLLETNKNHATCPTCLQPITNIKASLAKWRAVHAEHYAEVQALEKQEEAVLAKWQAAEERSKARRHKLDKAQRDVDVAWSRLMNLIATDCPHDLQVIEQRYQAALGALAKAQAVEADATAQAAACQFWVSGFKDIRLALVRKALAQFEVTTNSALALLGLPTWEVTYDVESETKAGKTSKGFRIFVQSPYNDEPVPFTAWSGGESQRLRLAVTLGLSDLIQDFCGVQSNLEVFDEPTAWLSAEGIADLLSVLESRARERQMCIMLADHKALDQACASRVLTVIKTSKGSQVETT